MIKSEKAKPKLNGKRGEISQDIKISNLL